MLTRLDGLIQTLDALRSRIGDHHGSLGLTASSPSTRGSVRLYNFWGPLSLKVVPESITDL